MSKPSEALGVCELPSATPRATPDCNEWRSFSGQIFNLLDPDPNLITAEDIGHHLARTCRWSGGVPSFYSVAEHSLRGMFLIRTQHLRLPFLLHDAHEMPLGDVHSPLKALLRRETDIYEKLASGWDFAIAQAFGFDAALFQADEIRLVDVMMRGLERKHLLGLPVTLEDSIAMQGLLGNEWETTRVFPDPTVRIAYSYDQIATTFVDWVKALRSMYHAKP